MKQHHTITCLTWRFDWRLTGGVLGSVFSCNKWKKNKIESSWTNVTVAQLLKALSRSADLHVSYLHTGKFSSRGLRLHTRVMFIRSDLCRLNFESHVYNHILLVRGDLQRRDSPQLLGVRFSVTARLGVDFSALLSAGNSAPTSLYCVQECTNKEYLCGVALLIMITWALSSEIFRENYVLFRNKARSFDKLLLASGTDHLYSIKIEVGEGLGPI